MPKRRFWVRLSFSLMAAVAPFAFSAVARAEACGDQTCPKNWECRTESAATPGLACAPGANCPMPEPTTVEYCAPLPCTSDADCASDMVCYSETRTECNDPPPCAKDADCAPVDVTCNTVTESACVPRYVPPCGVDADCGVGFKCEAQEECSCGGSTGSAGGPTPSSGGGSAPSSSGSAGASGRPAAPPDGGAEEPAPAEDGGAAPPDSKMAPDAGALPADDPPECVCTPSKTKTCRLVEVACNAASDCPAGFTCEDNPSGSCWASSDGSSGCDVPDPAKICAPPYTDLIHGGRAVDDIGLGTGAPEPPKSGSGEDGNSSTGGSTTGGSNPTTGGGTQEPDGAGAAPHDSDPSAASEETTVTHAGCSIANAPDATLASYGLVALGLAGLFGARRRRR